MCNNESDLASGILGSLVNAFLRRILIKVSGLDSDSHARQVLLHHFGVQVQSVVLFKTFFFEIVAEKLLK